MLPQRQRVPLFTRELVVLIHEAGPDQHDVTDLDIASLGGGADVYSLRLSARLQVGVGDGVRGVAVVGYVLGFGVGVVVEEEGAAGDAVGGPVVDAVFEIGVGAVDIGAADVVVEGVGGDVGELEGRGGGSVRDSTENG